MSNEPLNLSIPHLSARYRAGDLTPAGLVAQIRTQLRARIETPGPNPVWIHVLTDAELEPCLARLAAADPAALPLYGIPFAIKDNIDLAGVPTTAACPAFAYTPGCSAHVVERLIAAGAIPIGIPGCPLLAFSTASIARKRIVLTHSSSSWDRPG